MTYGQITEAVSLFFTITTTGQVVISRIPSLRRTDFHEHTRDISVVPKSVLRKSCGHVRGESEKKNVKSER